MRRFALHSLVLSFLLPILCAGNSANAQDIAVMEMARKVLSELQLKSFEKNREFCGYIGLKEDGEIAVSRVKRGRMDSCRPPTFTWNIDVIASFHTHGAFDPEADSEVPSLEDILSDFEEGTNGYVSTPGGRFWFIDGDRQFARQICGRGCLPTDPNFRPDFSRPVPRSLSAAQAEIRQSQ